MITIENLTKTYRSNSRGSEEKIALNSISLNIEKGETVAVIGQNGSGKSTFLSIMAAQIPTYEGVANIYNIPTHKYPASCPISFAAEHPAFNPNWRVRSLFEFIGGIQGLSQQEICEHIEMITDYFQLEDFLDDRFGSLSKGMKQRVNLSQSLISKSDLIIWDEPTSGLDWVFTDLIENKMKDLKSLGKTILFSSHDLHLTKNISDKVLYLKKGKSLFYGTYVGWSQFLYVLNDPMESRLIRQV